MLGVEEVGVGFNPDLGAMENIVDNLESLLDGEFCVLSSGIARGMSSEGVIFLVGKSLVAEAAAIFLNLRFACFLFLD